MISAGRDAPSRAGRAPSHAPGPDDTLSATLEHGRRPRQDWLSHRKILRAPRRPARVQLARDVLRWHAGWAGWGCCRRRSSLFIGVRELHEPVECDGGVGGCGLSPRRSLSDPAASPMANAAGEISCCWHGPWRADWPPASRAGYPARWRSGARRQWRPLLCWAGVAGWRRGAALSLLAAVVTGAGSGGPVGRAAHRPARSAPGWP